VYGDNQGVAWATGILVSLRRNCKDYLTSTGGRYCEGKQTDEMVASARGGYTTNIKLGESPFSHVDHIHTAMKGSAKISTPSGVAQAGALMRIWCDGQRSGERALLATRARVAR
jgi:hypothetical protein